MSGAGLLSPAARVALARLAGREPDPIDLYTPSAPQLRFHASTHRRRLLRAGNRAGKSEAGAHEAWFHALGADPWGRRLPGAGSVGLVMCADWRSYVDVVSRKMWECAPLSMLAPGTDWQPGRGFKHQRVRLRNGSEILFRSAEQGAQAVAGIEAAWGWWDEVPRLELWGEVVSRIATTNGPLWCTMTPIGRPVRWFKELVEGDDTAVPPVPPAEDWETHLIRLRAEDLPWRTPESIAAQIASYGPWERAQRVDGGWESETVDRWMDGFTDASLIERIPERRWEVLLGFDHGEMGGHEYACVVLWDGATGQAVVIDEYVNSTVSDPDTDAHQVRAMLERHGLRPVDVDEAIGDVNSAGKSRAGRTVNEEIGDKLGVMIRPASKGPGSVEAGARTLNTALRRGLLRVHPRCRVLIQSLRHWKGRDDDLKHPLDGLRYIVAPRYQALLRGPDTHIALH